MEKVTARQYSRSDGFGRSTRFYNVAGRDLPSVTSILGAINKPALVGWAAKQERLATLQAAADLYEDMPDFLPGMPKMARAAYLATLEKRLGTVKAHTKALEKAREIGTQTHAMIEWILRDELKQAQGPPPELSDPARWAFMAWEDWRKSVNMVPLLIEECVWSFKHGYAGTMDLLCEVDFPEFVPGTRIPWGGRGVALDDWKTGREIYNEAILQNAAYVEAATEMGIYSGPPLAGCIVRLPKVEDHPAFEVKWIHPEDHPVNLKAFLSTLGIWTWLDRQERQ